MHSTRPVERRKTKKRGSAGKVIAIILILLVIAALAAVVIFVLGKGIGTGQSEEPKAEVSVNPNDPNMYYVTVRAPEGSTLVYEISNGQRFEHQVPRKNGVIFSVSATDLLPVEPIEGDTCTVTPKVYTKEEDGSLTPMEMPSVTIKVPQLDITFDTADSFVAENGVVEISGSIQAAQRAAQITIDGETVAVAENGSFSWTRKMDKGEYDLAFLAQLGGHSIVRKTFHVTVEKALTAEEVVVIPRSFVTRALNVEDSIRVNGTVPTGASVTVTSQDPEFSLKSQPEVDENGNFTFEVNLPTAAKAYEFVIIATLQDGSVFERQFCVERPPVFNEYVPTVWADNYDEMIKPIRAEEKRGFKISGTLNEILYDGDYLIATLTIGDGHTIEIEYHNHYSTASTLEPGSDYIMFGYPLGMTEEGVLRVFIWFVQD